MIVGNKKVREAMSNFVKIRNNIVHYDSKKLFDSMDYLEDTIDFMCDNVDDWVVIDKLRILNSVNYFTVLDICDNKDDLEDLIL